MKLKTIKRTKTTSIVLANDEYWGILPDKILHFYCKGQLEYFKLSDEAAAKLLEEIKKQSWNKLLDYLAYRERSFGECSEFLSKKIFLKKGASETVEFEISSDDLSIIDDEGNPFVEAGDFEILVGDSSETTNFQILTVN